MDNRNRHHSHSSLPSVAAAAGGCPNQLARLACDFIYSKLKPFAGFVRALRKLTVFLYRFVAFRVHPFWIELSYFITLALLGSLVITIIKPRSPTFRPRYVDMLFMAASAVTVSGLNTVDTEIFSEPQIIVLAMLMLFGGSVFVSLLSLLFTRANNSYLVSASAAPNTTVVYANGANPTNRIVDHLEMSPMSSAGNILDPEMTGNNIIIVSSRTTSMENIHKDLIKQNAIKCLGYVVLCYILVFHVVGFVSVLIYLNVIPSARQVLTSKGLRISTFAATTVVSSFANGGLIAANENLGRFKTNSGLLLMIIPLILAGNTQYPACLRIVMWICKRFIGVDEYQLLTRNPLELEFPHLFPVWKTISQSLTSVGIQILLLTLFCSVNWFSDVFSGLNAYQKLVGALFSCVNSRHSGEVVFDFSIIAPAVLVLFIAVMYLPAYTYFDTKTQASTSVEDSKQQAKKRANLSEISYIVVFIIIACILERKKIKSDPLNFNVLNMVFEVVSAYGNVGLSQGYSCGRKLTPDADCIDAGYSFSGRWSDAGKLLIVFVMLFGRIKTHHLGGGTAWKLN